MDQVELLKIAVFVLCGIATTLGSALIGVVVWYAKSLIASIKELQVEVRGYDTRITRLEARKHWRLHQNAGGD